MSQKDFKIPEPHYLHLAGLTRDQIANLFLQMPDHPIRLPLLPASYSCAPRRYQIYVDIPLGFCIVRLYSPLYKIPGATAAWFKRVVKIYDDVEQLPF